MYADKAYMVAAFGEDELVRLTDRDGLVGAVVDTVLNQALVSATATIDGYLHSRYPLPLASIPAILKQHCADIARYYLYDNAVTEVITKRYEQSMAWLTAVATGKISIGPDDTGASVAESNNTATINSAGSVFSRQKSRGFI